MTEQATLNFDVPAEIAALPEGQRRLAEMIHAAHFDMPASASYLAPILQTDLRTIAANVEELIVKHRLPIGSVRGKPAGYYWIRTREELDAACAMLHATAMKLLVREAALKKITIDDLLGQMRLDLERKED